MKCLVSDFKILRSIVVIGSLSFAMIACNGENIDSPTEYSCSQAEGIWTLTKAMCDGAEVDDVTPITYHFDQENSKVSQTLGRVDCATTYQWDVEIGSETPLFSMSGSGALACSRSGVEVDYCSSEINSCNSAIDITGIKNEYPTCVITDEGMAFKRTVSAVNNPDNLSFCGNGEEEVVLLIQGEHIPEEPEPDPEVEQAWIEIDGVNPVDFGTHAVGSRVTKTVAIVNTGSVAATAVVTSGLLNPFYYLGGEFPGTGGTCQTTIDPEESCILVFEFFANSSGYFLDTLVIQYNNGIGDGQLNVSFAGEASQDLARLTLSNGPFYDFGPVAINSTKQKTFVLTNSGEETATNLEAVTLAAPFQFTGGAYPGLAGSCGTSLAAAGTCQLDVEFAPTALGAYNSSLQMQYFDGANSQLVKRNIFGIGIAE